MAHTSSHRRVLFVTPNASLRNEGSGMLRAAGFEVVEADSPLGARSWLRVQRADLVMLELGEAAAAAHAMGELLAELRGSELGSNAKVLVLVHARSPEHFRGLFEDRRITNFIAVGDGDRLDALELSATVDKILSTEIFGFSRYLGPKPTIERFELRASSEKEGVVDRCEAFARQVGCHPRMAQQVAVAVDELVTNAIYNAPVDAEGNALYAHLPRSVPVALNPEQAVTVELGSDGRLLCIAARDPFGSLPPTLVLDYLARCFSKAGEQMSERSGGAGLGLYYLFNLLHSFVINLAPGRATESIGLVEISRSFRAYATRGRSFNLFISEGRKVP